MTNQAERLRTLAKDALGRIERIASEPSPQHNAGRMITISSGKGGVGKTFIAVNTALALAREGKRVLLFDADFGLANVNVQLGVVSGRDLGHFARGEAGLQDVIVKAPEGLDVLSGGSGLTELYSAPTPVVAGALAELGRLSTKYDAVIVDTGAGLPVTVQKFITGAPRVVLVTTPEPTAITDAYAVLKFIAEAGSRPPVTVVSNMCDEQDGLRTYNSLRTAVQSFLRIPPQMKYAGNLSRDSAVPSSILAQRAVIDAYPDSRISSELVRLARALYDDCAPGQSNLAAGMMLSPEPKGDKR